MRRLLEATPPDNLRESEYRYSYRYRYAFSLSSVVLFASFLSILLHTGPVNAQVPLAPVTGQNVQPGQESASLFTGTGTNAYYGGLLELHSKLKRLILFSKSRSIRPGKWRLGSRSRFLDSRSNY